MTKTNRMAVKGRKAWVERHGAKWKEAMPSAETLQSILEMGLPDQAIHSDEIPWVPQAERALD